MKIKFKTTFSFFSILFFVLFSFSLRAESDKHIMWEVKSDSATVYLLGSIHVGRDDIYPLDTVISNSFERSDFLVVEVDMNKINPFELMKQAYYKNGDSLRNHLSDSVYKKLMSEFKKLNIKESFYSKMKPWFAVLTLTNLKMSKNGFDAGTGIDMHFLDKAKEEHKEVLQLETPEFQITLLDSILGDMQEDFVVYTMEDIDSTNEQVDEMFNAWIVGDVEKITEIAAGQYEDMPNPDRFIKAFVYDRNINMEKKIVDYLKTGKTYFVVVGAAHLVGDKGIVQLLKNENKYIIIRK